MNKEKEENNDKDTIKNTLHTTKNVINNIKLSF